MPSQCKLQKKFCNLNISAQKDYWIETHIQQFLSFYPQQERIFQLAAEGLSAVAYNRDWRQILGKGLMKKKKPDMTKVQKRQCDNSVIRPFPFLSLSRPGVATFHGHPEHQGHIQYRLALKCSLTVSPQYRLIIDAGSLFYSCFDLGFLWKGTILSAPWSHSQVHSKYFTTRCHRCPTFTVCPSWQGFIFFSNTLLYICMW